MEVPIYSSICKCTYELWLFSGFCKLKVFEVCNKHGIGHPPPPPKADKMNVYGAFFHQPSGDVVVAPHRWPQVVTWGSMINNKAVLLIVKLGLFEACVRPDGERGTLPAASNPSTLQHLSLSSVSCMQRQSVRLKSRWSSAQCLWTCSGSSSCRTQSVAATLHGTLT